MTDAREICMRLNGRWYGNCGAAPCPVCQPDCRKDQNALSIAEANGKILLYCFKSSCSFSDIAKAADLSGDAVRADFRAYGQTTATRTAYEAKRLAKARDLWEGAKPIVATKAEKYLRGRGINCDLPDTLRFVPDLFHAPSTTWACAMVGKVAPTGGVHRTFFDEQGAKLSKNDKMMLGPCSGGAVRLSDGQGPLVLCEGIETGLSLLSGLLDRPATVWATLSTSGMKALHLPKQPGELIVATDGDQPGREAGDKLATRAHCLGWSVSLMAAPEDQDWNDVLQSGAA